MNKIKLKAMLKGHIAGDAMGVPFEFISRNKVNAKEMIGFGTYDQPKGSWSDDTVFTLATLDNLIENGSQFDLLDKFVEIANNNYIKNYNLFDVGVQTNYAIIHYKFNDKLLLNDDFYSNGNGSIMRIHPLVVIDTNQLLEYITNYSSITHAHKISIIGCYIYVLYLKCLFNNLTHRQSIKYINQQLKYLKSKTHSYDDEIDNVYARILSNDIEYLNVDQIKSTGYIVDSLEAAIWCVINNEWNSFEDHMFGAINLGGDTDTIAAMTGALYGAKTGDVKSINKFYNEIILKDQVDQKLNNFIEKFKNI
mgnify:FL=1